MNKDLVLIGKIVAVQGIKGQLRIDFYSDSVENFKKYSDYYLKNSEKISIKPDFYKNKQIVATVNGIKNRNESEKLIGQQIFIERSALDVPKDGEFYIDDLEGLDVHDVKTNEKIAVVHAIHNFGAGDIIEVKYLNREKNKYIMYAFDDANFPLVDIDSRKIYLSEPETEEMEL